MVTVPEPDFISIGEEDEGSGAMLGTKGVGVISSLSFPFERIATGALCFHDRKWSTQTIQQCVVGKSVCYAICTFRFPCPSVYYE